MFRTRHLNNFKKYYPCVPTQGPVGHEIGQYLDRAKKLLRVPIERPADFESVNRRLSRPDLRHLCEDGCDPLFLFCAVMAWGMRKRYGWRDFDASIRHRALSTT